MQRLLLVLGVSVVGAAILAVAAAGPLMSKVEHPPYTVERADGAIELRDYPAMVVAATTVEGSRSAAIQTGFRTLADYIFGANDAARKIEMTAPVLQGRSESEGSASASPASENGIWTVRFVMPRATSMSNLPAPKDRRVALQQMPASTFAVIRFSGFWRDALLQQKTKELEAFLKRQGLAAKGDPVYAFYNPPWTLPFFRRNEVMIEVQGRS